MSPSNPASAPRAERTASPVPSGCSWIATSTALSAYSSRAAGEAMTTSGLAPASRPVSMIQSTIRRPRISWKCFGTADFIRVPSPPAITTAARGVSATGRD